MLVMIAMDRFQAVCYPMTNRVWKPSQSNLKIVTAWTIALVTIQLIFNRSPILKDPTYINQKNECLQHKLYNHNRK